MHLLPFQNTLDKLQLFHDTAGISIPGPATRPFHCEDVPVWLCFRFSPHQQWFAAAPEREGGNFASFQIAENILNDGGVHLTARLCNLLGRCRIMFLTYIQRNIGQRHVPLAEMRPHRNRFDNSEAALAVRTSWEGRKYGRQDFGRWRNTVWLF